MLTAGKDAWRRTCMTMPTRSSAAAPSWWRPESAAGLDVPLPPRAAAQLRKDELSRERLAFTIRAIKEDRP
jgi:hypothetical protein